jgi:hypothetical protein
VNIPGRGDDTYKHIQEDMAEMRNDPLYRDLDEGYLTESSDGATAILEILVIVVTVPIMLVIAGVRWLFRGR